MLRAGGNFCLLKYFSTELQYFSHQNPHLNYCFYRGLWILPWGTKIYAPSIQHKMEYRAAHIHIFGTFNIYLLLMTKTKIKTKTKTKPKSCIFNQVLGKMRLGCFWNVQSIMVADNVGAEHQFQCHHRLTMGGTTTFTITIYPSPIMWNMCYWRCSSYSSTSVLTILTFVALDIFPWSLALGFSSLMEWVRKPY